MARKEYDIVHLTNTPSFYKINLCNEIGKHCRLLVVFMGYNKTTVNRQLNEDPNLHFDYISLSQAEQQKRNKVKVLWRLVKLMCSIRFKKVLYAGWFVPEYNLLSFFIPRRKNAVLCESSVKDVSFAGIKGLIKRAVISRMSAALPSGELHIDLFRSIGFKGDIYKTGGVGIFHKASRASLTGCHRSPYRYLYVGRLVPAKNVEFLLQCFNRLGKPLTIVGAGVLEEKLRAMAAPNITFTGFVPNDRLSHIYDSHDVFVLPSVYEPWGLVVDEAIYWGLPVIASDVVGSSVDMVTQPGTGVVFRSNDADDFIAAVNEIENNYQQYKQAVDAFDFDTRDRMQVEAYLKLIK